MVVQNLPLQPLVEFARRVKKNVPTDIIATGKVDASITLRRTGTSTGMGPVWQGGGEDPGFESCDRRSPIPSSRWTRFLSPSLPSSDDLGTKSSAERGRGPVIPARIDPRVDVGPFNLALGRTAERTVRGQFSRSGYNFLVQGDAEVQRLLEVARTVGLPAPQTAARWRSTNQSSVGGGWAGFAAAAVTGTAQLHSVRARVRGLNEPVEISSASIELTPAAAEVRKLTASVAGNTWRGSLDRSQAV